MAEFKLPLKAEGAVTAPAGSLDLTIPTAESVTYFDTGEMNVLEISEFGWACADGVSPMRLFTRGSVYSAGGLAPSTAPTLAVTGAGQASVIGTYSAQPGNDETVILGLPARAIVIEFKTTLVTDGTDGFQVKRDAGGDADVTFANLQKLIQGTGTQGVEYFNYNTWAGLPDDINDYFGIEVSDLSIETPIDGQGTITIQWIDYGSAGNAAVSTETVAAGFAWASATLTGGSDGTGTAPAAGTYRYFYTWFRDADGAETGRSPIATITKDGNANIDLTVLTASADATFDYTRVYRTPVEGVEFYLAGSIARAGTTMTDGVSDATLVDAQPWNDLLHRAYTEGMPPRGRALALFKGRLWTTGARLHAEYSRGTVAVTVDSATITFSVQGVTDRMVGRTFKVASTSEEYTILSVAEGGPTAVIDRIYEGTTNGTASYTIKDAYDAAAVRASIEFLYNQWPVTESPGRVEGDDSEGGTGLLPTQSRLFAFSKTSVHAITGLDQESWEMDKVADSIGCAAPGMVVAVEEGGMFLSPEDGFYAISPDTTIVSISSPKAPKRTVAQGIDGTVARIAWGNIDQGYSIYDKTDRVVIFGVPLDGATVPNYEIVFDLQNGAWMLYKRAEWTAQAKIANPDGSPVLIAGDREGNLWHANLGESDGFYGTEAVQTLSGAQTVRVLTVSGTPFSTSEDGKPVIVLYKDGSTVAYGKVASSTTSALTLAEDLTTAPTADDQVILGGIGWQAKSGFTTFGEEYRTKTLRSVTLRHAPATRGRYFLSFAVNGGSFQLCPVGTSVGDMSEKDGKVTHITQWPGDTHAINVRGFKPGGRAVLRGGVFDIITRENGRV